MMAGMDWNQVLSKMFAKSCIDKVLYDKGLKKQGKLKRLRITFLAFG